MEESEMLASTDEFTISVALMDGGYRLVLTNLLFPGVLTSYSSFASETDAKYYFDDISKNIRRLEICYKRDKSLFFPTIFDTALDEPAFILDPIQSSLGVTEQVIPWLYGIAATATAWNSTKH